MNRYKIDIVELQDRIFYMHGLNSSRKQQKENSTTTSKSLLSGMLGKDITILMTPLSNFDETQINLPQDKYHDSIISYLRNGTNPGIIITTHVDRLIIETMKGKPKHPRIFMQSGNEIHNGFAYYKDKDMNIYSNELMRLVNIIKPKKITLGGAFLQETEKELKEWNLTEYPWKYSADSGCYVGAIYLMFRDRYPISIDEKLILRQ